MATGTPEEIEEERRLFYVACTRAKNHLYVTHPLRYYTQPWGKSDTHGYAQRTRFLAERVLPHFVEAPGVAGHARRERRAAPRATTREASATGVRGLWS